MKEQINRIMKRYDNVKRIQEVREYFEKEWKGISLENIDNFTDVEKRLIIFSIFPESINGIVSMSRDENDDIDYETFLANALKVLARNNMKLLLADRRLAEEIQLVNAEIIDEVRKFKK